MDIMEKQMDVMEKQLATTLAQHWWVLLVRGLLAKGAGGDGLGEQPQHPRPEHALWRVQAIRHRARTRVRRAGQLP